ncbi:hypothetical protein Tco_0554250 [Tanacetum coccineum]
MLGKKRAVKQQQQESLKRQKLEDDKETDDEELEADDTAELKKHLLLKEGIMAHYLLIRADGSSKRYSSMIRLLQGIDREDLQTL